jgi:membrane protease YdiL (CAAX protease family)
MSPTARAGFWSTVGWTLVIWAAFIGSALIGAWVSKALGAPPVLAILAKGVAPAIIGIAATLAVQAKAGGVARSVGLRPADRRSLLAGLLAGLPLLVGYGVIFTGLDVEATTVPYVGLVIAKFAIAQGIAEEVVFRGFVFARLRAGRSFLRAATLSAVVFSLVHLSNFLNGFSADVIISVMASTLFAFVLAYPAALLFERAGNTIWPFAITHFLIDSVNWFAEISVRGPALYVYLVAVLLTAGWTTVLALRLAPRPPPSTSCSPSRTEVDDRTHLPV